MHTTFAALSDPTRCSILDMLAAGEMTVMDISDRFTMSQPAISRHLKVLETAGLITRRVDGAKRPCALSPAGIEQLEQWATKLRRSLVQNYDRLDAVLAAMPSEKETS
ncbi:ArsR/SmtB family transcription factor [Yoonia sp. MH D7]